MGRIPPLAFALLLSLSLLLAISATAAMAQTSAAPLSVVEDLYYNSPFNGFRILLPDGWVIEDYDSAVDPTVTQIETYFGFAPLARICPEDAALPGVGGTFQCQGGTASESIMIMRFSDLKSKPEFASVVRQNKTIVPLDILPLHLEAVRTQLGFADSAGDVTFRIVRGQQDSIQNRTAQVVEINPQTNQAVAIDSVPANFVEVNYRLTSGGTGSGTFFSTPDVFDGKVFSLYVLSEDGNIGYAVYSPGWPQTIPTAPSVITQMIESFGLMSTPSQ